ncbi:hypothetical protein SLEP1_g32335 [Rubroshorea leprosula]|uniref:Uncharacterized protein n=1 Tax=Rubroshorea leprosula TaxID=152421 RepID=A0AAV5KD00_9ROSI|nr:hypothetical protein SLEP1_g32335 [Rubroshorea leprosula]
MLLFIGNEIFERLATYGLMANFMVYLEKEYHMHHVPAATILINWSGASNFAPIIGAYISDAYVGKFGTIVFSSLSSFLGIIIMTLTAMVPALRPPPCTLEKQHSICKDYTTTQISVLILRLCCSYIGTGGTTPCSVPFSLDQFDSTTEEGRKGARSFFNLYFTSQAIVLVVAQVVIVYIQDKVSWAIGFGVPTFAMLYAVILFLIGRKIYVLVKPAGTIFSGIAQVFVAAYRKRNLDLPNGAHDNRCLNKAALIMDSKLDSDDSLINQWRRCSVQHVEDVKCLLNVIPIWLTMAAITICLPLYDRLLVPALEKITNQEGGFTFLQRIGIGNMFAVLNLLVSGFVERKRRESAISYGTPDGVAPMSVIWLAPQLILLGFVEMFGIVGLIEFYNKQFPNHMRSIGTSLLYLSLSLSSYSSSFVVNVVHKDCHF